VVDWVVTIVGAVAIVLAIKAWVVNPYRIPSSSMEPTLHCARPATGCEARFSDRVLANRFLYHFKKPERGDIVVFETTERVRGACNAGGTFVKRIIGLPGETVTVDGSGFVSIDGRRLDESRYIEPGRRGGHFGTWRVGEHEYFMMGDNRRQSCDSRSYGPLPEDRIIGEVFAIYWPPQRIGPAAMLVAFSLLPLGLRAGRRPPRS
jgi:signal peptidase I